METEKMRIAVGSDHRGKVEYVIVLIIAVHVQTDMSGLHTGIC
jgi:hypothetical protein